MWREFTAFGATVYTWTEDDSFFDLVQKEAVRIEQKFSRFIDTSVLSILNRKINFWVSVDAEFFYLLSQAQNLNKLTAGALDITIKSILDSWGYNDKYELDKFTWGGATGRFDLDFESKRVFLRAPVDFGSFGKGYFLDQCKKIAGWHGVKDFFVNAGGDLVAFGCMNGNPWETYFEDPRNVERVIGKNQVKDCFCASSSPARRKWLSVHHLVESKNKRPANLMRAVYTQSKVSGLEADAFSTALFVMGYDRASQWLRSNAAKRGLAALIVSPDGLIWKTEDFSGELFLSKI